MLIPRGYRLPSAGVGALLALLLLKLEFFIRAERTGLPAAAAVRQACELRFRPILMTTLAAALGDAAQHAGGLCAAGQIAPAPCWGCGCSSIVP